MREKLRSGSEDEGEGNVEGCPRDGCLRVGNQLGKPGKEDLRKRRCVDVFNPNLRMGWG